MLLTKRAEQGENAAESERQDKCTCTLYYIIIKFFVQCIPGVVSYLTEIIRSLRS